VPNRALLSTGVPAPASAPERGVEAPATGASCGVLLRYKVKEPYVVLACAALGIALH